MATASVSDHVSDQVKRLIKAAGSGERSSAELMKSLKLAHAPTFLKNFLTPALKDNWIERTQPDSPRNPTQRYRLAIKGSNWRLKEQQKGAKYKELTTPLPGSHSARHATQTTYRSERPPSYSGAVDDPAS
ncbi:MAG: hypothetical protein ACI9JZ_001031 [Lentimonas sp.]|jgi:hypothetical protein